MVMMFIMIIMVVAIMFIMVTIVFIVTMSELRPASCEGGAVGAKKESPLPRSNICEKMKVN